MTERLEVESWKGRENVDIQRTKKFYTDLINDIIHPEHPCNCPSCLFQEYKKQGGKYNKEIFFLSWLEFEILFSLVNQTEKIVFETAFDPGSYKRFIEGEVEVKKFLKGYGRIKALSEFVKKNFPEIDHNQKRLKLRLWRFKKSGVELKAAKEIQKRYYKIHPFDFRKSDLQKFKLAQKIADFIYSQPKQKTTQREICRKYFQKKSVEDLEEMRSLLNFNYGIIWDDGKRKNQIIYIGKMKSSRGVFFKVGP